MNSKDKSILFILGLIGSASAVAFFFNLGNLGSKAAVVLVITALSSAGYLGYRKKLFENIMSEVPDFNEGSVSGSWDASKAREEIEEWSKEEFEINDKIEFRWNDAEFDEDVVVSPEDETEKLYAFWTSFGEADKKVIVYVNATQGSVGPYRLVGTNEKVKHPFAKWSYWKTCQQYMRRRTTVNGERSRDSFRRGYPSMPRGMPQPERPPRNQGGDSEDE